MTLRRALITGVAGFAAGHLAELLLDRGWVLGGFDRPEAEREKISHLLGRLEFFPADLRNPEQVRRAVSEFRPTVIFHLGAVAFLPHARKDPSLVCDINIKGSLHVLLSCLEISPPPRVVLISSAEVYGRPDSRQALSEDSPLRPANLYAWSKFCAEEAGRFFHRTRALDVVILRPFNHIGPRQSPLFVSSDIALQLARAGSKSRKSVVKIGNLDAARDFTDVRDIVRGYLLAAEKGKTGRTYNLCSGRAVTIREILGILVEKSGLTVEIRKERERLRPGEVEYIRGDRTAFSALTGWEPKIPLAKTLEDVLDYWTGPAGSARNRVNSPG